MARAGAETDVVFGSYTPVCDSLWTEASAIAYVAPPAAWGGRGPFVASLAIRRRAFGQSGGFPPHRAAEDLIWLERLGSLGLRLAYAPDALVWWQTARNPTATYRRFALYSHHNLAAGRGRFWHAGLARLYGALVLAMVVLILLGGIRLALAAFPAFLLARALKAALRRRGSLPFETLAPHRVLGAGLVLAIVDVATFVGVLRWLRCRQPARGA
jgi:GT2 family glycosyltransferase